MVAHPDDCVIFAYSLIHHFRQLEWHVCYLTYEAEHERACEFQQFWQRRGITTEFLGFIDDYRDIESGRLSFDTAAARDLIHHSVKDSDVVVTHDANGDYGHPHHAFVNRCVSLMCHDHVITFAPPDKGTHTYEIDPPDYDTHELPLHFDVIKGFHSEHHRNSYNMSHTTYHRISHA